eukprot:Gb_40137 [translate_table: standard]
MNSSVGSILPSGLQRVFLESIFALGRAQLSAPLLSRYNPLGSARLDRVKNIIEEGESLQLQFPAEDLGFRYERGALIPEFDISNDISEQTPTGRRREYVPSSKPGSRLPHMQIKILSQNKGHVDQEICSTLDLISGNLVEFLLIVAPNKKSCVWADAALQVAKAFKVPLKVCIIWPGGSSDSALSNQSMHRCYEYEARITQQQQSIVKEEPMFVGDWRRMNMDFVIDAEEITGSWWELCKMSNTGAILVRPDEHIAWKSESSFSIDAINELNKVFSTVLKKPELKLQQLLQMQ